MRLMSSGVYRSASVELALRPPSTLTATCTSPIASGALSAVAGGTTQCTSSKLTKAPGTLTVV